MSPLWRDEIGVFLSPHRLCLVRMQRGVRPQQVASVDEVLEPQEDSWSLPLARLGELLAQSQWGNARVRVVFADHWARYAIVPWIATLRTTAEQLAHGRQLLAGIYGETIIDWEVRLSEAPPQASRVACAVRADLLAAVQALCTERGVRLMSLQPQLIAAYNAWRPCLPSADAWFVSIEQGSLAAARLSTHGWDRVHGVRIGSDWLRELKRLQTFGRIASRNPNEGNVYVDAPHTWRTVANAVDPTPGTAETSGLRWLGDESGPVSTLQRLNRARRLAA